MAKTREDLVNRALNKLGAVGAGQSPAPEDAATVDDALDAVMADLSARGIYAWADESDIDLAAYEHLADVLSVATARDFGKQPDENVRLIAESRLRQIAPVTLSGRVVPAEYY